MEFAHVPSYSHSEGADTATSNPEQIYPQRESSSYKLKMILNDFWHAIFVHVLQIWDTKPPILQRFFFPLNLFWRLGVDRALTGNCLAGRLGTATWRSRSNTPEPLLAMEDKQFWWANKAMTWIWYPNEINEGSSLACSGYSKRWAPIPVRLRYWDHEVWWFHVVENEDSHILWRSSGSCGHGFMVFVQFSHFVAFFWVLFRQLDWVGAELPACQWPARHLEIKSGLDNRGANKTRTCWMGSRHFHRS